MKQKKPQPRSETLRTVNEIAELFRTRPATVYRWIRDGKLVGIRLGHQMLRIPDDEIAKFIGRNTTIEAQVPAKTGTAPQRKQRAAA